MANRGRPSWEREARPIEPDLVDTDAGLGFPSREELDTDMSSLERQLWGSRPFEGEGVLEEPGEASTMLHRSPSEAETVYLRGLGVAGATGAFPRPVGKAAPPPPATPPPPPGRIVAVGGLAAATGAFATAGFALVGFAILVALLATRPAAPPAAPPTPAPAPAPAPADPPAPAVEPPEPIRFPAAFRTGETTPRGLDPAALDALVEALRRCPGDVRITGHADRRGSEAANDTVALGRATTVRTILVGRGLDPQRLQVASAAASAPEADEDTPDARARNRRVTVACE